MNRAAEGSATASARSLSPTTNDVGRLLAISLTIDVLFTLVTTAAFLRIMGRSLHEAMNALLVGHGLKLMWIAGSVIGLTRPITRWRRAPAEARDRLAPAAWVAADRAPIQIALLFAAAWGSVYLLVTALLPGPTPSGAWPIALLLGGGLGVGAIALSTVHQTLLVPAARDVSLEAMARGIALPPSRARFRRRQLVTTLAVGLAPNLWVSSLALALGHDVASVVLFSLIAMLWLPLAAWFQASAIATPLSEVTAAIARIGEAPAAAASLHAIPVFTRDELGQLARNVNELGHRLAATLASLREHEEEQKRLLDEIEAKRQLLDAVLQHTPVAIALLDMPDHRFRFFNPACQQLVPGRPLLGRTLAEAVPEAAQAAARDFAEVARTGTHRRVLDERFSMRHDGTTVDLYITRDIIPVEREGQLEALLLVVEDTTQRVRARQRIEELAGIAERRAAELQAVLDNMVDSVLVCDVAGRITLANRSLLRVLDVERLEDPDIDRLAARFQLHDASDGQLLSPSQLPLRRALGGETVTTTSFALERRGLQVELRGTAAPIRDSADHIVGAVAVYRDVTELVELDRLKDQFIHSAAHELKTPVAVMKTRAQTLLRMRDVDERLRGALEGIDRGADRMTFIVRDLLELSEVQLGRLRLAPQASDLVPVIDAAVERAALLSARHRIRRSGPDHVPLAIDAARIGGVLDRLLRNAIRYSPAGGDVDVSVQPDGDAVRVSVRDHGIGVPAAQQRRLFECFYRAHADTAWDVGGLGVGLFLARAIVELHGGNIGFDTQEGVGSTFWFRLPTIATC